MVPTRYRVRSRRPETADAVTLALEAIDRHLDRSSPGQFNMLYAFGVGEVPISLSGEGDGTLLHTIRSVGAVSRALSETRRGGTIGVRGPYGTGWPIEMVAERDLVVVAGGIGLAPLRPVIRHALAHRRHGRIAVLVGARTPEAVLFQSELRRWAERRDVHVAVIVDRAIGPWGGRVGLVTELVPRVPFDLSQAVAMVCGPEVMMRFSAQTLVDQGVPPSDVYVSLERNMKCGIGHCGHCQLGPVFVCLGGPVFPYERVAPLMAVREL